MTATGPSLTARALVSRMDALHPLINATGLLDIGCGTGSIISHILDTYASSLPKTCTLIAADYSPDMVASTKALRSKRLTAAQSNTPTAGVWSSLAVHELDAHDTSSAIVDCSLSHVLAGHVYFLLANPQKALHDTYRALTVNGILAISVGHQAAHADALEAAIECVKPGSRFSMLFPPWNSEVGIKVELETCGFVDIETFVVEEEMPFDDIQDFAKTLMWLPVVKNVVQGWEEREKDTLIREVMKELEARVQEGGKLGVSSIVALAWKR